MTINTNLASIRGNAVIRQNQAQAAKSIEKLSTGKRINRASYDPSGLIAATQLGSEINKLAAEQTGDDRLYLKAAFAENVLGVVSNVMLTAKSITVQNASSTTLDDKQLDANQHVIDAIIDGVDRINIGTTFLSQPLFGQTLSSDASKAGTSTGNLTTSALGVVIDQTTGESYSLADLRSGGSLSENQNPEMAAKVVDAAIKQIAGYRSDLGNFQNTLVSMGNVRGNTQINLKDALSRIEDTDFATETATLARSQILTQSSIATTAIANTNTRTAMSLLV